MSSVATIWDWGASATDPVLAATRMGVYVLRYEGTGTIRLSGKVEILSERPGEIVFRQTTGDGMVLSITQTDPLRTGDYLRDITIVKQEHLALFEMGQIFNPDWLALVQDARQLRFMEWMKTNGTTSANWADRPQVGDASYSGKGVPVEVMVALANQTGTDPWFTMPAGASEEYIRNFATYVRDHLKPGLVAHVEYSNEMWNWNFAQTQWLGAQAKAWSTTDGAAWLDYAAMLATKAALIWDGVFGAEAEARVDNVLGTQTANSWIAGRLLTAPLWAKMDPGGYVAPSSVFDSLAVTTYFGGATMASAALRDALVAQIKADPVAAAAWLTGRMLDPAYAQSIPQVVGWWAANKAVADKYGLDLVAYEGGQHLLQGFAIGGMSEADQTLLTTFLSAYVRGPEMARLYGVLWEEWAKVSDGPFMQFGDVGLATKWGAWGLYTSLGDSNPRAELLEALNAAQDSWFGTGGGAQYQQGTIQIAAETGETLTGTALDDWLIGASGNDRFTPGKGNDVIAGEGGLDTLVMAEPLANYTLTREGNLYRLTGQDSSYLFRSVEVFQHGATIAYLDQYLPGLDNGAAAGRFLSLTSSGAKVEAGAVGVVALSGLAAVTSGVTIQAITSASALGQALGVRGDAGYFIGTGQPQTVAAALATGSIILGNKVIRATGGDDVFQGRAGHDFVQGLGGNDLLIGRRGNDKLDGGFGMDTLNGGLGNDTLRGGPGADTFIFSTEGGHDVITDFTPRDRLDLRGWGLDSVAEWRALGEADGNGNLVLDFGTSSLTLQGLQTGDMVWMNVLI